MALMAYFTTAIVIVFYDPILSDRMVSLGVSEEKAGLPFSLLTCSFAVSSSIMGYIAEKVDRRRVLGTCFSLIAFSVYLTGTSSITITLVGLGFNGVFIGGIFAPIIPEVIDSM